MKKAAVCIGVDKSGSLPVLKAAAAGAARFAEWARGQKYEVVEITDGNGKPVTIAEIKKAVWSFCEPQVFHQLIVYFAGHGILKSPAEELWLLTDAPEDAEEAINVFSTLYAARNCRIPHVVLISDACRSTPTGSSYTNVRGSSAFRNFPIMTPPRPEVDQFYAAPPGEAAFELPGKVAAANYQAVFTTCLLEALEQQPDLIKEQWENPSMWVITSGKLKPWLEKNVPARAAAFSLKLNQTPDIVAESHRPTYLLECPASGRALPEVAPPPPAPPTLLEVRTVPNEEAVSERVRWLQYGKNRRDAFVPPVHRGPSPITRDLRFQTGFSVVNARILKATVTPMGPGVVVNSNRRHVTLALPDPHPAASTIFLQFHHGSGVALAVLPGFVGTVVVRERQVVQVSYAPSPGSPRADEYDRQARELEYRRALVAEAASSGQFRIPPERASASGDILRTLKNLDPTLGLYAVYAYAQVGNFEEIESVYSIMEQAGGPLLYDVALLAGRLSSGRNQSIAPFCPMFTQGWSLLEDKLNFLHPALQEARRHLLPSLWTTFDPDGCAILQGAMQQHSLQ
jgi:hypothetical protein